MAAITADAGGEEEAAPVAPTAMAGEGELVTAAPAAVGPAFTRSESASGRGMGAVRAAMVEGLYEAMRERLACQAEEVGGYVEIVGIWPHGCPSQSLMVRYTYLPMDRSPSWRPSWRAASG